MSELGPNQRKWIEALRSGRYEQGRSALCDSGRYCCLGVGCEVLEVEKNQRPYSNLIRFGKQDRADFAPTELMDLLGLRYSSGTGKDGRDLADMNDRGLSFSEIADAIEADPSNWFTAPT